MPLKALFCFFTAICIFNCYALDSIERHPDKSTPQYPLKIIPGTSQSIRVNVNGIGPITPKRDIGFTININARKDANETSSGVAVVDYGINAPTIIGHISCITQRLTQRGSLFSFEGKNDEENLWFNIDILITDSGVWEVGLEDESVEKKAKIRCYGPANFATPGKISGPNYEFSIYNN